MQLRARSLDHPSELAPDAASSGRVCTINSPTSRNIRVNTCAFVRLARGKEMVFFDRRARSSAPALAPGSSPHTPRFGQLRQGPPTALGESPQDARFVGIANGQLLGRGIGREDPGVDKAQAVASLITKVIDLVDPALPKAAVGPSDVGVVANLRLGIVLTTNEHTRHHILGHDTLPSRASRSP